MRRVFASDQRLEYRERNLGEVQGGVVKLNAEGCGVPATPEKPTALIKVLPGMVPILIFMVHP
jgi:hypothetical protein